MPQKNQDKSGRNDEETVKSHKSASKPATDGSHEKTAHHAQAGQGHQQKTNEHSGKTGTMKKDEMENEEMEEGGNGRKSNKK